MTRPAISLIEILKKFIVVFGLVLIFSEGTYMAAESKYVQFSANLSSCKISEKGDSRIFTGNRENLIPRGRIISLKNSPGICEVDLDARTFNSNFVYCFLADTSGQNEGIPHNCKMITRSKSFVLFNYLGSSCDFVCELRK